MRTDRFRSRQDLLRVPRLGPKAFEQAAGVLRIREGENPLDASAVHPGSYPIVEAMARDLGVTIKELRMDRGLQKKSTSRDTSPMKSGCPR